MQGTSVPDGEREENGKRVDSFLSPDRGESIKTPDGGERRETLSIIEVIRALMASTPEATHTPDLNMKLPVSYALENEVRLHSFLSFLYFLTFLSPFPF